MDDTGPTKAPSPMDVESQGDFMALSIMAILTRRGGLATYYTMGKRAPLHPAFIDFEATHPRACYQRVTEKGWAEISQVPHDKLVGNYHECYSLTEEGESVYAALREVWRKSKGVSV